MSELDAERRDAILGVLRANGLTDQPADYDSDIHSWRCRYPDRYGPCTCLDELADDLAPLVAGWLADDTAVCTTCQHRGGDDQPAQHPGCAAALGRIRSAALREAADLVESETAPDDPRWTASLLGYHGEGEWLRDRADRIEGTR